jgi:hypothetical protein
MSKRSKAKKRPHIHKWSHFGHSGFEFRECVCGRIEGFGLDNVWSIVSTSKADKAKSCTQ